MKTIPLQVLLCLMLLYLRSRVAGDAARHVHRGSGEQVLEETEPSGSWRGVCASRCQFRQNGGGQTRHEGQVNVTSMLTFYFSSKLNLQMTFQRASLDAETINQLVCLIIFLIRVPPISILVHQTKH